MRGSLCLFTLLVAGCGSHGSKIAVPELYPPVRASTPTALIGDPSYGKTSTLSAPPPQGVGRVTEALNPGDISLGTAIQERLYIPGPTELLRIVKEVDDRVAGLDTDPEKHPCLTGTPVATSYALPNSQTFGVKLQCLEQFSDGSGWVGFGFDKPFDASQAASADAGAPINTSDFYLVEGQSNGMGGAYRIDGQTGNVEGWLAVADRNVPANSQVIAHLLTNKAAGTLELTLAGAAVGFCSAHLKTDAGAIFIRAKTNSPPAPGTTQAPGEQSCSEQRIGCFAATALGSDLGADASDCSAIVPDTFAIPFDLDASAVATANVTPATIYTYFSQPLSGIPAF